jgi:hypothetical protein
MMTACPACSNPFENLSSRHPLRPKKFCSRECRYSSARKPGKIPLTLKSDDAAYIAGFIDGDGSLSFKLAHGMLHPIIQVTNRCKEALEFIAEKTGVGFLHILKQSKKVHARRWLWSIGGDSVSRLMLQLHPYFRLRTKQAGLLLEASRYLNTPSLKRDLSIGVSLLAQMRQANKRGRTDEVDDRELPPASASYWAGFFDAEGSVILSQSYNKRQLYLRLTITSTAPSILRGVQGFGGGVVNEVKRQWSPVWKTAWDWNLYGKSIPIFLNTIQPYAIVKREQIRLALDFCLRLQSAEFKKQINEQLKYREKMKRMNQRGVTMAN